jgi:hypothetical protein
MPVIPVNKVLDEKKNNWGWGGGEELGDDDPPKRCTYPNECHEKDFWIEIGRYVALWYFWFQLLFTDFYLRR